MPVRTALDALTMRPTRFLRSAWPWRSLAYLTGGALLVVARGMGYGGTSDVVVDLRVDDHPGPVTEMARLLEMHTLYFERPDPATLIELDGPIGAEVRERLAAAGHPAGPSPADLDEALASWAGIENLEERIVAGAIDPLVLDHLGAAGPPAA